MSVISIDNASHYRWGENCDAWHLLQSAGLSVIQERVPAGAAETRHYHQAAEQFFFVLSGIARLEVDGQIHDLHSQQGLQVIPGVSHRLSNPGDVDCHFIVVSSPPSHGDRVETE